jgi:ankyrin repeat protein
MLQNKISSASTAAIVQVLKRNQLINEHNLKPKCNMQEEVAYGEFALHDECKNDCRSSVILQLIEQNPQSMELVDFTGNLPLHLLLRNMSMNVDDAITMIDKYPAALEHCNKNGDLPIHIECRYSCRSSIISKCIERYPESLTITDWKGFLPFHLSLCNGLSSIEEALMIIEKYPAATQHQSHDGYLPIHLECKTRSRSSIISKCIELFPAALAKADAHPNLPLHLLLYNSSSLINDALMMIEKYPTALQHQNYDGDLPLHIECLNQCRSSIITKCIELYPDTLFQIGKHDFLPMHRLLQNKASSIDDALMLIAKYPAALQHRSIGRLPINIECANQCRPSIISKCIDLYPESIDENTISNLIITKGIKHDFRRYAPVLSLIFTARPMSVYDREIYCNDDIRDDPYYRRRILNLLPHHVFTPTHETDYRDLNWQPRAVMMILLSQIKIQHSSKAYRSSKDRNRIGI